MNNSGLYLCLGLIIGAFMGFIVVGMVLSSNPNGINTCIEAKAKGYKLEQCDEK